MSRKRTPRRVAQVLNALENFPKVTKEEIKLRKEQATAERLKLKAENRARRIAIETPLREAREAAKNLTIAVVSRPEALSELAPAPTSGPIAATLPQPAKPSHGDEFLTRTVYDGDGVPQQEYVRDRNGNPVPAHKSEPARAPQPKPAEPVRPDPNREPPATPDLTPPEGEWFNGCGRPRSALERFRLGRAAGQGKTVSAGLHYQSAMPRASGHYREEEGFDDPGGVISHAIISSRRKWTTFGDWEP